MREGKIKDLWQKDKKITQAARLEKTFEITESGLWPNTTPSIRPGHLVPHPDFFKYLQGLRLHHLPWQHIPMLNHPFRDEIP